MDVDDFKISGKVLLYTSQNLGASPTMTVKHDTVSKLPPVLQKLAGKFSPLCSLFTMATVTLFKYFTEMDSCTYVSENKMWTAKGRFSQTIHDDDPIAWDASPDGKYTLSLLAVSI
jgi:hypothetical protein